MSKENAEKVANDFRKMSLDVISKLPDKQRSKVYKKFQELEKMDIATIMSLCKGGLKKEYDVLKQRALNNIDDIFTEEGDGSKPFFVYTLVTHEKFKVEINLSKRPGDSV